MKKIFENAIWWSGVVMVGLVLGISLQFVRAWTEPTDAPPGGNVGAPINTAANFQWKGLGGLGFLGLTGGLETSALKIPPGVSGTPQAGYVLTAIDASGTVAWRPPSVNNNGGNNTDGYCKMVVTQVWNGLVWVCDNPAPDQPAYCESDGWCACSRGTLLQTASGGGGQPSRNYTPGLGDWGEFTCLNP